MGPPSASNVPREERLTDLGGSTNRHAVGRFDQKFVKRRPKAAILRRFRLRVEQAPENSQTSTSVSDGLRGAWFGHIDVGVDVHVPHYIKQVRNSGHLHEFFTVDRVPERRHDQIGRLHVLENEHAPPRA